MSRALTTSLVALLLAPAAAGGQGADPADEALRLLGAWAALEPDAHASVFAGLAGAALAFGAIAPSTPASGVLDALAPLLDAHAIAARALAGEFPSPPGAEVLGPARDALAAIEAWQRPGLGEALEMTAFAVPDGWGRSEAGADAHPLLRALAAQPRPAAAQALPPMPHFPDLGAALEALALALGAPPSEELRRDIAAFQDLPAGAQAALQRIVEAHIFLLRAVGLAYDGFDPAREPTPGEPGFDLGLLMAARGRVAAEVLEAAPALPCIPGQLRRQVPAVGFIDLSCDSGPPYEQDVALIIDAGGDDIYLNNAGGAMLSLETIAGHSLGAALLVDLAGHDRYLGNGGRSRALNGGASIGAGFLFDFAGDDFYEAAAGDHGGVNGGAFLGSGFLFDAGGNDSYSGAVPRIAGAPRNGGVNGATAFGAGFLFDGGGHDAYSGSVSGSGGVNGGALQGTAMLLDLGGNDTYAGVVTRGAVNGAADSVASGVLLDLGGADTYQGDVLDDGVANGAGLYARGLLLDAEGNDSYLGRIAGDGAANGAGFLGSGLLVDAAGNDTYDARAARGALNGAALLGQGLLVDRDGDDGYAGALGGDGGVNGGALFGLGVLVDGAGTNRFAGTALGAAGVNGGAGGLALLAIDLASLVPAGQLVVPGLGLPGGVGVLLAGPGDDTYASNGTTQGAGSSYGVGVLMDPGGSNRYAAGPGGLAQGAGQGVGLGVLLDRGSGSRFDLLAGATGQGAGLQGVGLLLQPEGRLPEDVLPTVYAAAPGASRASGRGAGVGLLLDAGDILFEGLRPLLTCPQGEEVPQPVPELLAVCLPDRSTRQPVVHPLTGEPLDNLTKPGISCAGVTFGALPPRELPGPVPVPVPPVPVCPVNWPDIIFDRMGPEAGGAAKGWMASGNLEASTSGGLAALVGRDITGGQASALPARAKAVIAEFDHACDLGCRFAKSL